MKTIYIKDDGIDIVEKYVDAQRVPTIEEVQLLFKFEKDLRWRMIWLLLFCAGMRPYEVQILTTQNIIQDPYTLEFVGLRYQVAKAKVRKRKDGTLYKEVKIKTIYKDSYAKKKYRRPGDIGDYVMEELEKYYHAYKLTMKEKRIFGGIETSRIRKEFSIRRKRIIKVSGGEGFADLITDNGNGAVKLRYRIELYSGRRFFLTFYHFTIAGGDIVRTQRRIGHTFEKDTFTYVHTKESIGFNPEIHQGYDILVNALPKEQLVLTSFLS